MCSRNAWLVKEAFWEKKKKTCPWIMYQNKQICQ